MPPDLRDDLHAEEERELEQRFGLTEAVVAGHGVDVEGTRGARRIRQRRPRSGGIADAAAIAHRHHGIHLGPEQVAVATALTPGVAACRAVVQLDGAMSTVAYQTGADYILSRCADVLRAEAIRLPAPLYADPSTVASMRSDSVMSRTLEAGRRADVMLFGVGAVSTSTTLFEGSFLDTRMLDELVSLGAVGEIGGRFFDADGVARRHRTAAARDLGSARGHPVLPEDDSDLQRRRQASAPLSARSAASSPDSWFVTSIVPVGYSATDDKVR